MIETNPQHNIFLCDIDGTVADLSHRLPLIHKEQPQWDEFFAACGDDKPIDTVLATIQKLYRAQCTILFITGRPESSRRATYDWFYKHKVPFQGVYMRRTGDHRQDYIVKAELLEQLSREWNIANVVGVFEDRKQCVDMFREKGFTVFQVADGNY